MKNLNCGNIWQRHPTMPKSIFGKSLTGEVWNFNGLKIIRSACETWIFTQTLGEILFKREKVSWENKVNDRKFRHFYASRQQKETL